MGVCFWKHYLFSVCTGGNWYTISYLFNVFNYLAAYWLLWLAETGRKYMVFRRQQTKYCHINGLGAGATPVPVVRIYTEIHRSGKLTVNHTSNWHYLYAQALCNMPIFCATIGGVRTTWPVLQKGCHRSRWIIYSTRYISSIDMLDKMCYNYV